MRERRSEDYPELKDLWPLTKGEMRLADLDRAREAKWEEYKADLKSDSDRFAEDTEKSCGVDWELLALKVIFFGLVTIILTIIVKNYSELEHKISGFF